MAHNTFRDTIAIIVLESGKHVQKKVSHLSPLVISGYPYH
jgi:hypothetical protein